MAGYIGNYPTAVPLTGADLTDGIITPAKLSTTLDLSSKTITLPAGVGGKILQVVQGNSSTQFSVSNINNNLRHYPTSNKLTVSITPSSASSKIIVNAIATVRVDKNAVTGDAGVALVVKQIISGGATAELYPSSAPYSSGMYLGQNEASQVIRFRHNEIIYSSPATTNLITYEVGVYAYASSIQDIYLNDNGSRGEIIVYEVQG